VFSNPCLFKVLIFENKSSDDPCFLVTSARGKGRVDTDRRMPAVAGAAGTGSRGTGRLRWKRQAA